MPQVKWYLISGTTNVVYELPHELLKDLSLRKYWEYYKNDKRESLVPSVPSVNKNLVLVVKNYGKKDFKVFLFCSILLDFLTLFPQFCL